MPDVTVDILAQMQGADNVTKDLNRLEKEGQEVHKTFKAFVLDTGFSRLRDQLQESTSRAERLNTEIDELADRRAYAAEMDEFVDRVRDGVRATRALNGELDETGKIVNRASSKSRNLGKTPSSSGGVRSESAGQILSGLSQLTGIGSLQAGADAVGLIGDTSDAVSGLREMGLSIAPLAPAAGAAASAFALVKISMSQTAKDIEKVVDASKRHQSVLEAVRSAQGLSADALVEQLKDQQQAYDDLTRVRDEFVQGAATEIGAIDNIGDAIGTSADAAADLLGAGGAIEAAKEQAEEYNRQLGEQAAILERLNAISEERTKTSDVEKQLRLEAELADLRKNATAEEIQNRIDAANVERNIQQQVLAFNEARLRDLQAANEQVRQATGGVVSEEELARERELQAQVESGAKAVGLLDTELQGLYPTLIDVTVAEREHERQLERIEEMTNRVNEAREADERRLAATQKAYTQSVGERDRAEQQLLNTESQLAALESDRAKTLARRAEEEALTANQGAREAALQAQIDAARTSEAIQEIRSESSQQEIDIIQQATQAATEAWNTFQQDIARLNAEWMKSELRAIQDFNLEQKRLREDTEADLRQAALDNDVNAFLQARDSAITQLSRNSEDFGIERQRSKEDFDQQLTDMQVAFQEQEAERRRQTQESLNILRQETNQRIQIETDAANGRLTRLQQLEQQMTDLQTRFGEERAALRERWEQEDYNARVDALNRVLEVNRTNFQNLERQTANLAYNVGAAAARGFFAGAQGQVDASIQVAINQAALEIGNAIYGE
jgi:hypothetical protein